MAIITNTLTSDPSLTSVNKNYCQLFPHYSVKWPAFSAQVFFCGGLTGRGNLHLTISHTNFCICSGSLHSCSKIQYICKHQASEPPEKRQAFFSVEWVVIFFSSILFLGYVKRQVLLPGLLRFLEALKFTWHLQKSQMKTGSYTGCCLLCAV